MPELPEVETTLRGIAPHVKQQIITDVIVRQYQLRWRVPSTIRQILLDKTVIQIERRGKYLLLKTQDGAIMIHLGMSGNLRILTKAFPPNKHDHIDVMFSNKKVMRFCDPRRFGAFLWIKGDPYHHSLLKNLGVEPLTKAFSGTYLKLRAKNRTTSVKSFIMDNKIVTGVGNIYAAEALFEAGIYPGLPIQSLSIERLDALTKAIKKILKKAIKKGGTTLKDFVNSNGKPGYFANQLKVYGRAGLLCTVCHTLLRSMCIGQRSTVYCEHCQI